VIRTAPLRLTGAHHREPAGAAPERLRRHHQARRVTALDAALHAQPRRKRQTPEHTRRDVSEINRHQRKSTCLQDEGERLDRAIDDAVDRSTVPSDPEQTIEIDPGVPLAGKTETKLLLGASRQGVEVYSPDRVYQK
jgi:hypothetical protein